MATAQRPQPSAGELAGLKLLTAEQTGTVLGLSRTQVRRYLTHPDSTQRLPAFRLGSRWCVSAHLLDDWIAAHVARTEVVA